MADDPIERSEELRARLLSLADELAEWVTDFRHEAVRRQDEGDGDDRSTDRPG